MKVRSIFSMWVLVALVTALCVMPAMAQTPTPGAYSSACFQAQGGSLVMAASGCVYKYLSGATITVDSGTTETHANAPTFSGTTTFSGATIFNSTVTHNGTVDLNSYTVTVDDNARVTIGESADVLQVTVPATATVNVLTGNLKVGDGTPGTTEDGEDAYIEGTLEVDGASKFDAAMTISTGGETLTSGNLTLTAGKLIVTPPTAVEITAGGSLTPASTVVKLAASGGTCGFSNIVAGVAGQILILIGPAANTITITDTSTTMLNTDRALSANDTLTLVSDGTNWMEVGFVNN